MVTQIKILFFLSMIINSLEYVYFEKNTFTILKTSSYCSSPYFYVDFEGIWEKSESFPSKEYFYLQGYSRLSCNFVTLEKCHCKSKSGINYIITEELVEINENRYLLKANDKIILNCFSSKISFNLIFLFLFALLRL